MSIKVAIDPNHAAVIRGQYDKTEGYPDDKEKNPKVEHGKAGEENRGKLSNCLQLGIREESPFSFSHG